MSTYPPPYPERANQRSGPPVWAILLGGCGGCGCLAALAFIAFTYFFARNVSKVIQNLTEEMREAKIDLKIQEHRLVTYQGKRFIVGTLKNISPQNRYNYAAVEFKLFDAQGTELDSTSADTEEEIKPGGVWRFKAPVEEKAAVKYTFHEVTGFKVSPEEENMDPETKAKMEEIRERTRQRIEQIIEDAKQKQAPAPE